MLAIRMQRVGRKGHPEFRVVVQDSRTSPTSERVVARIGHYNPHTKAVTLDKEKIAFYLKNGAQPSPRVIRLLQTEKITIPEWVEIPALDKKRTIKNPEKLRRNRPAEEVVEEPAAEIETPSEPETQVAESPAEEAVAETAGEETVTEVEEKAVEA